MLASWGRRGVGTTGVAPQLVPAMIAIRRGRLDEAAQLLAEAERSSINLSDIQTRGQLYIETAELAIERGLPDDAYAAVERALALVTMTDDASRRAHMCAIGVRALADRLGPRPSARTTRRRIDRTRPSALRWFSEASRPG